MTVVRVERAANVAAVEPDPPTALFVSREVLPFTFGGGAKLAAQFIERAQRLRFLVVTLGHPEQRDQARVRYVPVQPAPWLERFRFFKGAHFVLSGIAKALRLDYQAVVANGVVGTAVAIPLGVLFRRPRLSIIYDVDFLRKEFRVFNPLERLIRKSIMSFALRHSDRIIVGSPKSKRDMITMFGIPEPRVVIATPGVDPVPAGPPATRPTADFVLLYVGSFRRSEGIDDLIRATARVAAEVPRTVLLLIGKEIDARYAGELRALVRELRVEESVRFLGRVDDIWSYVKMCDVFVSGAYLQKGFSMPVCEASACGKPVVATNYLADVGVFVPGETGLSYRDRDVEELTRAILQLVRDPQLRQRLGERGWQFVQRFQWDVSAHRFEEQLLALLAPQQIPVVSRA